MLKIKNKNAEIAIVSLINKFFWKSKIGPITTFALPLIFMTIYNLISKDEKLVFVNALPAFICLSILPITLITLPQMLVEIKQSIVLRRISTSSVKPIKYNLLVSSWFFIACICSTIIVFIIFLCFLNVDTSKFLSYINWGEVIYSLLMFYIVSISVGILIASLSKKSSVAQMIGIGIMFITLILGGQFIPISVIGKIEAIKYLSLFSPINYASSLLNNCLINPEFSESYDLGSGSIFSITDFSMEAQGAPGVSNRIIIISKWQKILNLIMPELIFIGFNFIAYKKFEWSTR